MNPSTQQWNTIPTVALNQIFEYLDHQDRISASSTCWHWRQCLFQKRYFKNFCFHINMDYDDQLSFFHERMAGLAKELIIVFDILNPFHLQNVFNLLCKVGYCDNIQALRFQTHSVGPVAADDMLNEHVIDIEECFILPLTFFLSRKRSACQVLDFGAIEALTYYGQDFLKALSKPEELQELTLASIKYDPSHYPILAIDTTLLQKCTALQVLSLDYDTLSDEVLHTIQGLPLRKLLIAVHGLDPQHTGVSESAWASFSAHFTGIELILTLVYAYEAIELLQAHILRRNMPVTRLRLLFCDYMNMQALDWISLHHLETLRSIYYIDSAYKHSRQAADYNGVDSFIMMAWRCKQLEEIVVHGYIMDPQNLVGIARLRGRQLQRLEVSMIDWSSVAPFDDFNAEMCTLLGKPWAPSNAELLHPALRYGPLNGETRDNYVYELLRNDLSK